MKTRVLDEIVSDETNAKLLEEKAKKTAQVKSMLMDLEDSISNHAEKKIVMIPVTKIIPDPNNARDKIDENKLWELAESIRSEGVQSPIKVVENKEKDLYELIFGERRWRASLLIGLEKIPATIEVNASAEDRLFWGLTENVQRENLSEVQRARQIALIKREFPHMTFSDIGKRLGYNKMRISQFMRISKLPEEIQSLLENVPGLTERHIRAINNVNKIDAKKAIELINEITDNPMSGDEIIARAKQIVREIDLEKIKNKKTSISSVLTRLHSRLDKIENDWDSLSNKKRILYKNELAIIADRINDIIKLSDQIS